MITTINNKHNKLNFSSEREQSQACLNSAEHEKNQGRKVLNVPNLRFPEFQGEWITYKIKNVLRIGNGRDYKHLNNGGIPVFGTGGYMTSVDECLYDGETTFIGRKGSINKPFYYNGKFWTVDTLFYTHSFNGITPKFTYCLFQTINWLKYNEASGVPSLSKDTIEKIKIKIPGLEEQNKIAKLMFALDERIATQNKIIDKLQSLIKGIRNDVFGKFRKNVGVNAMVGDVLSYEQPQPYIVEDTEYTAEGIPVLTANKAFVLGYTSETDGIYDKGDCIIFDDFTLDCKYVDFPFKVKSSAIKILTAKDKELLRYTFEFMKYLDLSTDEHKRHYIAETQNQELFLPTAQVVRTIAHAFSALSSRMKTVTKQRDMFELQKQYLLRQMFI